MSDKEIIRRLKTALYVLRSEGVIAINVHRHLDELLNELEGADKPPLLSEGVQTDEKQPDSVL